MADHSKIDAGLSLALNNWELDGASGDEATNATVYFEGSLGALEALGFETLEVDEDEEGSAAGTIRYADIEALTDAPELLWITTGPMDELDLDVAAKDTHARASSAAKADPAGDGLWFVSDNGATAKQVAKATGAGVIIGVIDTGIDYSHPMFHQTSGPPVKSRILRIWDQGLKPTTATQAPDLSLIESKVSYGVEFKNDSPHFEIDNALASKWLEHRDCDGHGTHVAGIAAGGRHFWPGGTTKIMGIAPDAELIIVKALDIPAPVKDLNNKDVKDRFKDAILYCLRLAHQFGKPIVINMSFGDKLNPGDGLADRDRWLDRLLDPASPVGPPKRFPKGAIAVKSAGNNGSTYARSCAKIIVPASGQIVVPLLFEDQRGGEQYTRQFCGDQFYAPEIKAAFWFTRPNPLNSLKIALRYPHSANFTGDITVGGWIKDGLSLKAGSSPQTVTVPFGKTVPRVLLKHLAPPAVPHPSGGTVRRHQALLTLSPGIVGKDATYHPGIYEVRVTAPENTVLYLMCSDASWDPIAFAGLSISKTLADGMTKIDPDFIQVGAHYSASDSGGREVITVANYNARDKEPLYGPHRIGTSSSWGPLRDYSTPERPPYMAKPEVAAPGTDVISAKSIFYQMSFWKLFDFDYMRGKRFTDMTGTSMAAPIISGLVALMLEKNPNLTVSDVRSKLRTRPGRDPTGKPGDVALAFGAGEIDALETHKAV